MPHSWPYVACALALTACTDQHQPPVAATPTGPAAAALPVAAAPTPTAVPAAEVPAAQRLPGQLLEAWRWADANGENLLVVYRTATHAPSEGRAPAPVQRLEDDARAAHLLARQYVRKQGTYTELWRLQDAVTDCPFDLLLGLVPHATAVTDLDHDGQSETTLLYALGCRSDVSPDDLRLILHEGAAKYALRGYTVAPVDSLPARRHQPATPCCLGQRSAAQLDQLHEGPAEAYMGRYFSEADFQGKPEFLRFARQRWQQFSAFDATAVMME